MCSTPTQHDWELTVGASLQQHGSCGCSCAIVRLRRSLLMPILVPNVGASPPRYGSSLHDGVVYFSVYPISTFSHHPTDRTVMLHCNGGPWASSGANNYHPPTPWRDGWSPSSGGPLQDQGPRTVETVELLPVPLLYARESASRSSYPCFVRFVPFIQAAVHVYT